MKHCPSPACPFVVRHGRAAEYVDDAAACSDCGAELEAGGVPEPAPVVVPPVSSALWKRAAVSAGAVAAVLALERVPMPGVDSFEGYVPAMLGALGLMPFISAFALVELVALAVPRWRPLRIGGHATRAKLRRAAFWLGVAFSVVQGLGSAIWIDSLQLYDLGPDLEPTVGRYSVTAMLVASALVTYGLARLIDVRGLGSGFAILVAASAAVALGSWLWPMAWVLHEVPVLTLLALCAVMWLFSRAFIRWPRAASLGVSLPLPSSGLAPLGDASLLLALVGFLASFGVNIGVIPWDRLPTPQMSRPLDLALVAAFTFAWAYAFNRPSRVAAVAAKCLGREPAAVLPTAKRAVLTGAALSALGLMGLCMLSRTLNGRSEQGLDLVLLLTLVAVAADLRDEWRFRRATGEVSVAWPLHRMYAVSPVVEALAAAGIPAHARSARYRSLLQFFGPYVPVEVLVPAEHAERAEAMLRVRLMP